MGRKLIIAAFLLSLAAAVYTYLSREARPLRDSFDKEEKGAQVVFEDFTVHRYFGSVIESVLTARLGHFYEPNVAEIDGEIRGERFKTDGTRETLSAESAVAYLKTTSLTRALEQQAELSRAEMSGFVEVGIKGHFISTDYAEYLADDQIIKSNRPVMVGGPNRTFNGEDGFEYNLKTETMWMPGTVKGVISFDKGND